MNEHSLHLDSQTREIGGFLYHTQPTADGLGLLQPLNEFARLYGGCTSASSPGLRKQLFLLDDSDDDAGIFERVLTGSFREIAFTRAKSVYQARELLLNADPDLITLDFHIPGECILGLLRDIRSHHRLMNVPVVVMSGTENGEDVSAAYLYGASSFLKKPFSCEEYADSVRLLLTYWLEKNWNSPPNRLVSAKCSGSKLTG